MSWTPMAKDLDDHAYNVLDRMGNSGDSQQAAIAEFLDDVAGNDKQQAQTRFLATCSWELTVYAMGATAELMQQKTFPAYLTDYLNEELARASESGNDELLVKSQWITSAMDAYGGGAAEDVEPVVRKSNVNVTHMEEDPPTLSDNPTMTVWLFDHGERDAQGAIRKPMAVTAKSTDGGNLEIGFPGYGEFGAEVGEGRPVVIELLSGCPRVVIFGDINSEDPTHKISLAGAKEELRGPPKYRTGRKHRPLSRGPEEIKLQHGIVVTLADGAATIRSDLHALSEDNRYNAAIDGFESLLVALASERCINLNDAAERAKIDAAIDTAVDAISNNYDGDEEEESPDCDGPDWATGDDNES